MGDQFKTNQAMIQESAFREYAGSIIDTVREPLIVLDQALMVVSASRSFMSMTSLHSNKRLSGSSDKERRV